jgi:hypothetical protein
MQHQGYEINGYTFYMRAQEEKSSNQNSGAHIDAIGNDWKKDSYYGVIEEIWKLDYGRGVTIDRYGMTIVDFKRIGYKDKPFILAMDVT